MELATAKLMVAPAAGTLNGNEADVDIPEGRVPRVIVGVAVVPVSIAVTVKEKLLPG